MPAEGVRTLASYVPWLRQLDDEWRLRVLLHDFGLVWIDAEVPDRRDLVDDEPEPFDKRWDCFMAALAEHLCWHARVDPPGWVFAPTRYLEAFWYPANTSPTLRVEAAVHAPAAFEAHGVLMADRELLVV
jgi:hypothetical protein